MSPREDLLAKVVAWYADHGVGGTSLRSLATEIGTSHRMLIYHFESHEGMLSAVVEAVERAEREALRSLLDQQADPYRAGSDFWTHVADTAQTFAPLFFELAGHAMQRKQYAASLRQWLSQGWTEVLADAFRKSGLTETEAVEVARLSLAMARGLLFELALTGDREAADQAMARFTEMVRSR